MSVYREFIGRSVEEALRQARDEFGVGLDELDFEILTSGSRGVLGMGMEPARIVAAPRSMLGGAAPKREAAAASPVPVAPREDRGPRPDRDRGPRPQWQDRGDRGRRPDRAPDRGGFGAPQAGGRPERRPDRGPDRPMDRGPRPAGQGGGRPSAPRGGRPQEQRRPSQPTLTAKEVAELAAARVAPPVERQESAEVTPEAMAAAQEILEQLMTRLGFDVRVEVQAGETNRLNVIGEGAEKDALGALIGRKGERLSALQHLLNLLLSKRVGVWTRVLVDVEDYRGRRERQLRDLANRAAERVAQTGKMLQLEPMPALERRWIHLALREHPDVATQSVGEEPNRRVVVLPREL